MKKTIILISALFLIFLFIGTIGVTNLFANLIVIDMISAEKTGDARKVYIDSVWPKTFKPIK